MSQKEQETVSQRVRRATASLTTSASNAAEYFLDKQKQSTEDVDDSRNVLERLKDLIWDCRYGIWVVAFYVAHVFLWMAFEPTWSPMQSVYFITASLTTVGYGDLSASDDHGRLYKIFFLLIGLAAVTSVISGWMDRVLEKLEVYLIAQPDDDVDAIAKKNKSTNMDVVGSNSAYRYRKIIFSAVIIGLCIACGTIYMCVTHEWSFLKALYWSFVTALTVGYGDVPFWHDDGTLLFVSIFMMVSTMSVAVALGNFVEVTVEIEQEERKKKCLDDLDLYDLLMSDAHKYDEVDASHATSKEEEEAAAAIVGGGHPPRSKSVSKEQLEKDLEGVKVSKLDFMLFMLEKLNDLDRKKDIDPLLKKFDRLDKKEDGFLDINDIHECSLEFEEEKAERKRREEEQQFSIMKLISPFTPSTEPNSSSKVQPSDDPGPTVHEVEVIDTPAPV